MGFVGGTVAFTLVTAGAGTGRVAPAIASTSTDWQNVVNRKILFGQDSTSLPVARLEPAINTGVAVSGKYQPPMPM